MEFFNRFFGSKKDGGLEGGSSEEEKNKFVPKKVDPSRRDFLKFAAGAAGTVALEKIAHATGKKEKDSSDTAKQETKPPREIPSTPEQRLYDQVHDLHFSIFDTGERLGIEYFGKESYGQFEYDLPPEQQVEVRNKFLQAEGKRIGLFLESLKSYLVTTYSKDIKPENIKERPIYISKITEAEMNEIPEARRKSDYGKFEKVSSSGEVVYALCSTFDVKEELGGLITTLKKYGCHGLVYKALSELGLYSQIAAMVTPSDIEWENGRMSYRTADFLPSAEQITKEEIDPIQAWSEKGLPEAEMPKIRAYKQDSKWGKKEYQEKFRRILSNSKFRQRLVLEKDLTHADSCSLIKSVIEYRERGFAKDMDDREILEVLIKERRQLEQEVFLDKETNTIRFHGFDNTKAHLNGKNMFGRGSMDKIVKIVGAKNDTVLEAEKYSDPVSSFLEAIEHTPITANTLIFVDTHGSKEGGWSTVIKKENETEIRKPFIDITVLARMLCDKLFKALEIHEVEAAYALLENFKIVAITCYGYDSLFKKFPEELSKMIKHKTAEELDNFSESIPKITELLTKVDRDPQFKKELFQQGVTESDLAEGRANLKKYERLKKFVPEKVKFPRVVAMSQEGNVVRDYFSLALNVHANALKKTRKLRGKDLLALQAEIYTLGGDVAFSASKDGQIYQISELEQQPTDKAV